MGYVEYYMHIGLSSKDAHEKAIEKMDSLGWEKKDGKWYNRFKQGKEFKDKRRKKENLKMIHRTKVA